MLHFSNKCSIFGEKPNMDVQFFEEMLDFISQMFNFSLILGGKQHKTSENRPFRPLFACIWPLTATFTHI